MTERISAKELCDFAPCILLSLCSLPAHEKVCMMTGALFFFITTCYILRELCPYAYIYPTEADRTAPHIPPNGRYLGTRFIGDVQVCAAGLLFDVCTHSCAVYICDDDARFPRSGTFTLERFSRSSVCVDVGRGLCRVCNNMPGDQLSRRSFRRCTSASPHPRRVRCVCASIHHVSPAANS